MIVEIPVFFSDRKKWMRVEVQIRTIAMDFWASLDHQLKYKKRLSDSSEEISAELGGVCGGHCTDGWTDAEDPDEDRSRRNYGQQIAVGKVVKI